MEAKTNIIGDGAGHDLLLFSDVHLGADLKRSELAKAGSFEALVERDGVDLEAGTMLDHYRRRAQGRRWRLVLAGDLVDFIGMNVVPADVGDTAPFEATEAEVAWGLEPRPDRCAWMMSLVVRRHPGFFQSLAAFLADGHELVLIRGNHDAAFFFPEVQRAFRQGLLDAARDTGISLDPARADAIVFEDWFHLEPGRIYVEHGHVHDEACSDPGGHFVVPGRPDHLSQPVSTLTLRYFGNRFPSLDLDNVDQWKAFDFLKWAFVKENPLRIARAFAYTMMLLLLPSVRRALRARRRSKTTRVPQTLNPMAFDEDAEDLELVKRAMGRLTCGVVQAEAAAKALARRVTRTARMSVAGILRMFCLDRMAAMGAGFALSAGSVALETSWTTRLIIVGALLVGGLLLERHLAAARQVSIGPKLRGAADELAPHLGVPLVVMGHSHKAVDTRLADGTRYVNLGSWLGAAAPARSSVDSPGFPHLVVRAGQSAEFLRWRRTAPGATGSQGEVAA